MKELQEDNIKLVKDFGAHKISNLNEIPDFYTFSNELFYSHRDFNKFMERLKKGEPSAIVSGFNASGTIHIGHKAVFDTNLFFQKKYGLKVFIPISDDESYVSDKVSSQEEALKNSINLAKQLIAYGFDPKKTYFIIDQIYTNIYNYSIMLSKKIIFSVSRATYGYGNETNLGLIFYPTVQSAHILFPQLEFGIKNILVPIGPDEDVHFRICRDLASKFKLEKPAAIHSRFLPGLDRLKMSKSKNNCIFIEDKPNTIKKKVNRAFSGGKETIEEHRRLGGDPEIDVPYFYLDKFFLEEKESKKLAEEYRKGNLLSSDLKKKLTEELTKMTEEFQMNFEKVGDKHLGAILTNKEINLEDLKNE